MWDPKTNKLKPGEYHIHLPLRTPEDLRIFIAAAWGVHIPDVQVCPNHSTPWRAFCDAFFAASPVAVWKASRGLGGKTFLMAVLGVTEAVALRPIAGRVGGARVNILGGSGEQSQRVLETMGELWAFKRSPRFMLQTDAQKITRLRNGAKIKALLASQASVRGPHPHRLRIDEVDVVDWELLKAALPQPMEGREKIATHTVLSSTHQNLDGTMTKTLAMAAEMGWPVHEWCYRETMQPHGWLSAEELERKRRSMAKVTFRVEIELQEPSTTGRAFDADAINAMFDRELGEFEGEPDEEILIEPPVLGATYATGADLARDVDWTVIATLRTDVTPWRLVAFLRTGRRPWPVMAAAFEDRVTRYPGSAKYDATGPGNAFCDLLNVDAEGVVFGARNKYEILGDYVAGVERGEVVGPYIRWMHDEHRLAPTDAIFSNKVHTPDSIVGGALAYAAAVEGSGSPRVD